MKVLVIFAVLVAAASARPRFLIIPLDDLETQYLPASYGQPLMRMARQLDQEEYGPRSSGPGPRDQEGSSSNSYAPAHPKGGDHVDYGAYTGGYGAFGWYTDHPVAVHGH